VDLDPYAPAEFVDVLEIADAIHSALDQMRLRHLMKTSGADGIHMFIPIIPKYEIEVIRKFVLLLGSLLENLLPKKVSTSRHHSDRIGKVYIDWFQNGLVKTVAAPFSLRPVRDALVSFPITPKDLKKRISPEDYNIKTVASLLSKSSFEFDMTPDQSLENAFEELGTSIARTR